MNTEAYRASKMGRLKRSATLFERFLDLMAEARVKKVFRKKVDHLWTVEFASLHREVRELIEELKKPVVHPPIPMLLRCPCCHERHIDVGEYKTKPHRTHACQTCGENFKPSEEFTVGVHFLPGHKN